MNKRILHLSALAVGCLGGMAFSFGGWAVITVEDLPQRLTVGQPVSIAFMVRQHGTRPLEGLKPTLTATDGSRATEQISAPAEASGPVGHYVAKFVVPRAGNWTLTINGDFAAAQLTLHPIPAAAGNAPRTQIAEAPSEQGRRLFVAKGCVTCHVLGGVTGNRTLPVGPDLTPKRYQADYLTKYLADPSIARTPGAQNVMPNLGLKTPEIAALVAFINSDRQVSAR